MCIRDSFHIGYGVTNILATHSFGDSDLNSKTNAFGSVILGFNLTEKTRVSFIGRALLRDFVAPTNIPLTQDIDTLFNVGATIGVRLGGQTYLSALWMTQQQNFVRNDSSVLTLLTPWVHGPGVQLNGPLINLSLIHI